MNSRDQEAHLAQLRAQYAKSLPEKLERMQAALELRHYSEILRFAHQLHGSGKSYGFDQFSEAAAAVEHACRSEQITMIRSAVALLTQTVATIHSQFPEGTP